MDDDDLGTYLTTESGTPKQDEKKYESLKRTNSSPEDEPPVYSDIHADYEIPDEPPLYDYLDPTSMLPDTRQTNNQDYLEPVTLQNQVRLGLRNQAYTPDPHNPPSDLGSNRVVNTQPQSASVQGRIIPAGAQVIHIPNTDLNTPGHTTIIIQQQEQDRADMTIHIVMSCLVYWFCNYLFGCIAFFIAIGGLNTSKEKGRQLGKISMGMYITGVIVTVLIIIILVTLNFTLISPTAY